MKSRIQFACVFVAAVVIAGCQGLPSKSTLPRDIVRSIEHYSFDTAKHPLTQIQESNELWKAGDRELSSYVYYVGQIRYRTYLMARPNLPKDADPAIFQSITYVRDSQMNEWMANFGNPSHQVVIIDHALDWHDQNDDQLTPKSTYPTIHKEIREGLLKLRSHYANLPTTDI